MDEVCDSPKHPIGKITPTLNRVYVLPLEGKGDRSAVDEVKMRTRSPSRSVNSSLLTPHSSLSLNQIVTIFQNSFTLS